jgi:hypothetical protein
VTDQADLRRLALDLLLAAADDDLLGLKGCLWVVNELSEIDRATVLARVDGMGARAVRELALIWDVTPADALRRLTGGST